MSARRHTAAVRAQRLAWLGRDDSALEKLLTPDAALVSDGGGAVTARSAAGRAAVARGILDVLDRLGPVDVAEHSVNGETGLVVYDGSRVVCVATFGLRGALVADVWLCLSPEKLDRWNRH